MDRSIGSVGAILEGKIVQNLEIIVGIHLREGFVGSLLALLLLVVFVFDGVGARIGGAAENSGSGSGGVRDWKGSRDWGGREFGRLVQVESGWC